MKNTFLRLFSVVFSLLFLSVYAHAQTPLAANGRLKVINRQLCNEAGAPIQLRGMSTHGLQWFGSCHTSSATQALANSWGCDVFRAAMYVDEGGYLSNKAGIKAQVDNITDWSAQSGMYCIIDWHVLNPGDPNAHTADAIDFFRQEAQRNAGKKHVIYEICNEPNGVSWASVKSYAEQIIPVIRQYDPQAIILVGTPNWSGTPADVTSNPLTGANAYNVMYTFHFYAGSHYTQSYINGVLQNIPLFISEWGTSNYSGNGGNDYTNAQNWLNLLAGANTAGIKVSWCNWSFCDKSETSAALAAGACGNGGWNNTSESGTWVKNHLLSPADNWGSGGTTNIPPSVSITSPANNAQFTTPVSVTINANASDVDGTITKVEFYNGTTLLGTVTTAPYTFVWSNVMMGNYIVTAKATDNKGAVTTSTAVNITVNPKLTNQLPTVSITSPTNNTQFTPPASITINANAADADGTITKVVFYNGTTLLGTDITAPYSFVWSNVAAGTYTLTAKATDNKLGVTTSTSVQVVVGTTTTTSDLIGVNCVTVNGVTTFELNAAKRVNATAYSWWCNGSTQSIVPTTGQPWKATYSFGQWFTGGDVCVGVNYSGSPYYAQFCKTIRICPPVRSTPVSTKASLTTPIPSSNAFNFIVYQNIKGARVLDQLGVEKVRIEALNVGESRSFGEQLPSGIYFLNIDYEDNTNEVIKLIKAN